MKNRILINENDENTARQDGSEVISISQMYGGTIQGEGIYMGHPALFLRLRGCSLKCIYCDTLDIWVNGSLYSINEVLDKFEEYGVDRFKDGEHLVLTGGSPLMQQKALIKLIKAFILRFNFKPFIEIENEAVIEPIIELIQYIDCWNNSPKLKNSGYNLSYSNIHHLAQLPNSWFKFVISEIEDWYEIRSKFIDTNLIDRNQVILMPCVSTKFGINAMEMFIINIAVKYNVKYSSRLHIHAWGNEKYF